MNYYRLHIGDYLRDASHLSLLEHGVFGRLLQVYYTREAPIGDTEKYRIVGARTQDERDAVDSVLAEFFILADDGWRQSRCDREIAEYLAKADRNREVGKLGGNPKKKRGYNEPGWMYAVQRVSGGAIKVGISKHIDSRLSALRNQFGGIVVLAKRAVEDMGASEAAVHDAFAGRLDGEWVEAPWEQIAPVFGAAAAGVGSPDGTQVGALANSQEPIANKEQKRERAASAAPTARGTRIPDDCPSADDVAWMRAERPDLAPSVVAAKFRDYWRGVPGSRGCKVDWPATWRNFVRGERAPPARAAPATPAATRTAAFMASLREPANAPDVIDIEATESAPRRLGA